MHKLTKAEIMREVKDYIYITLGLISYSLGWAAFLLPYQITTGGTTGIGAIIYYATGFPIQWSYFIINAVLMTFAIRILGPKFSIKTTYAIFTLTFLLWLFQLVVNNYVEAPDMTPDGKPLLLGTGQDFMACIIGAAQRCHGKCQFLVRTTWNSGYIDLCSNSILYFLLRPYSGEKASENTLSTPECIACTAFADSGTLHPYPGRIQRIHHEFKQGVFQSGSTHESCSH